MTSQVSEKLYTNQNNEPPTPEFLASKRLSELKAFLIAIENPVMRKEVEDDEVFTTLIQLAIDDYGVGQAELAKVLSTNRSTVGRWKLGQATPSIYSRPGILTALSSLISHHIQQRAAK